MNLGTSARCDLHPEICVTGEVFFNFLKTFLRVLRLFF